jgi:hypothetical protein
LSETDEGERVYAAENHPGSKNLEQVAQSRWNENKRCIGDQAGDNRGSADAAYHIGVTAEWAWR